MQILIWHHQEPVSFFVHIIYFGLRSRSFASPSAFKTCRHGDENSQEFQAIPSTAGRLPSISMCIIHEFRMLVAALPTSTSHMSTSMS